MDGTPSWRLMNKQPQHPMHYQEIISKYYPAGSDLRDIYLRHCRAVADEALEIMRRKGLSLDPDAVEEAAMLHDIGIVATDAPSIHCHGTEPYLTHGIIGAAMLRSLGVDETTARVAERHTGSGITVEEIRSGNLPIPPADYLPETLLEKLICYADKFHSKSGDMKEKPSRRSRGHFKVRRGSSPSLRRASLDVRPIIPASGILGRSVERRACLCGEITVGMHRSSGIQPAQTAYQLCKRLTLRSGARVGRTHTAVATAGIAHAY